MKAVARYSLFTLLLLVIPFFTSHAQFPEDALRLATPGVGVGSRALGMGDAYTGVASDYSAIYWNPAGLAQAKSGEFSFGMSHLNDKDETTFFSTKEAYSSSATNVNTAGLVYPVPVLRGSLVFAFGFTRQNAFTGGASFSGFNPTSSIIQSSAPDGSPYPSDLSGNIAYQLFLADIDTLTGRFISPIRDHVMQTAQVLESGGLNNWSIAGAVDIAENLSLGVTLNYVTGSYHYDRDYQEDDTQNYYSTFPYDFSRLTISEYVDSDINGFGAKFGLMYRVPDRFRFGLTIKTPTTFTVKEDFGSTARSYFDNGDIRPQDGPFETTGSNEYDVHTPWVFGAGGSVTLGNLLLSGDVEYTDWTQLEFANANRDILDWNREMKKIFRATGDYRVGAEYELGGTGFRLRGGFIYKTSPYDGDPASFDQKYITGGIGIPLSGSSMLDIAYARGWWETFRLNYDETSKTYEQITTNTILATFSYRF